MEIKILKMKKAVFGRKLGRTKNQRKTLFKGLIGSLVEKGKIKTTLAKAKAIKARAEKLITRAKKGSLADRRIIFHFLNRRSLVDRLVDGIAPLLRERKSGYLRIVKLGVRKGDDAAMAQISFVDEISPIEKPEKKTVQKDAKSQPAKEVKK